MDVSGDDLKTKHVETSRVDLVIRLQIGAKMVNIRLLIYIQCLFQAREDNLQKVAKYNL